MALAGQQQVRHIYVGTTAVATNTHAGLTADGEIAVINANGADAVVAAGSAFLIASQEKDGKVTSDVVDATKVLYAKSKSYVAPVLGKATISALTVDVNTLYTVELAISSFGSFSPEDEYVKKAFYKAVTGDDQGDIVDGLILSLNRNFAREVGATLTTNPYFTFTKTGTGATAALVIEENSTWAIGQFDPDKKTRKSISFNVNAKFTTLPTFTVVATNEGSGTGMQVADMEFYLKGERGDFMRGAGYPHNFNAAKLIADTAETYDIIEIGYFEEGRDEAKKSKKGITLAFPVSARVATNLLIAELNTAITSVGDIADLA